MKQLLLITVLFVASIATKMAAQEKSAIEIKGQQSLGTIKNDEKTSHQFEIVANENVDVNLKIKLKTEDNVNVVVTDKKDNVVFSRKFKKQGENKIAFTMEENEKYTVMLDGNKQSNLIVAVSEN